MKRYHLILITYLLVLGNAYSQNNPGQFKKFKKCIDSYNIDKTKKLIDKGYDINASDNEDRTALLYSLQMNNQKFAELFIENGADINHTDKDGNNCLHYAIEKMYDKSIVLTLIDKGADIHATNKGGYTPFQFSIMYACPELPLYLFDHDVDYKATNKFNQNSLHLSLISGCEEISKKLLAKNIDIELTDSLGNSPLMYAVKYDRAAVSEMILERNVDINCSDHDGYNLLVYAINNQNEKITEILLQKRITYEPIKDDIDYLHLAASHESNQIIELLLEHGYQYEVICDNAESCFQTALILANESKLSPDSLKANYIQESIDLYNKAKKKFNRLLLVKRSKKATLKTSEALLNVLGATTVLTGQPFLSIKPFTGSYHKVRFNTNNSDQYYIKEKIYKCERNIEQLEKTLECIQSAPETETSECY